MSDGLSPKRRAFCREYVLDSNGTAAAIRAGFSERSAKSQASQLLDMPCVKEEVARLQKAAAEAQNITVSWGYARLNEAIQIAVRKESATGVVAATIAALKLAGLWVERTEDLAVRAQNEATAQKTELKTAASLLGDAAESVGLPRDASPAMIVGSLSERPLAPPALYRLLHEAAKAEKAKQ